MSENRTTKVTPIELSSLNNECYKRIKEMILCGELSWGARIEVGKIAAAFGISKFPVIKAVERLSLEKLVTISPNRGTYVLSPTEEDIHEITDIRLMVEEHACRAAFSKDARRLAAALRQVEAENPFADGHLDASSFLEFLNYDRNFHMAIVEGAGNSRLSSYYQAIRNQAELFRTRTFLCANIDEALSSHRQVLKSLEQGDLDQAIGALHRHIVRVDQDTLASLNGALQSL